MKKFLFIPFIALFSSALAQAQIVETKYRVVSRYYDESGEVTKLLNTRVYIRYNDSVSLSAPAAKQDCAVTIGGKGLFRYVLDASIEECISNRNYIITGEDVVLKMMERAANTNPFAVSAFSGFSSLKIALDSSKETGAKLENTSVKDLGAFASLRAAMRNFFSQGEKTQMISVKDRTVFVLSASGKSKFTLELEPIESETLTH
ncbi:hypothetical protein EBZ37_05320 [bacterium]|nr:hypothetical protein [bacterium]